MENAAVFRRKIIFQEWEHKVLRMKIAEKKEAIKYIEKFKVYLGHKIFLINNRINFLYN